MGKKIRSKLGTIFYVWVIPLLFTVILGAILLNFLGLPVLKSFQEWGNKLPVVNNIIPNPTKETAKKEEDPDYWKKQLSISEEQLKKKDQEISKLKNQLSSNQKEIDGIEKGTQELQKQLEAKQTKQVQNQMKQVSGIYAKIPASKAAAMFETMPLDEASLTLSMLKVDLQSSILGSMKDAKKASQMTMMLKEIATLDQTDENYLKEQVKDLALKQENPKDTLSETISAMPSAQSAGIIQTMMGTNSQVAMDLMKNVSTASRSQILTEIAKTNAKLAANIASNLN